MRTFGFGRMAKHCPDFQDSDFRPGDDTIFRTKNRRKQKFRFQIKGLA
jgi:hypothetical protein